MKLRSLRDGNSNKGQAPDVSIVSHVPGMGSFESLLLLILVACAANYVGEVSGKACIHHETYDDIAIGFINAILLLN